MAMLHILLPAIRWPLPTRIDDVGIIAHTLGAQQSTAGGLEVESLAVVGEEVGTDPRRFVRIGGQVGGGRRHVLAARISNDPHPWVFEAVDAVVAGSGVAVMIEGEVVMLGRTERRIRGACRSGCQRVHWHLRKATGGRHDRP